MPGRGAEAVPRTPDLDPAVPRGRAPSVRRGNQRGDVDQGHGRVHQRVEPAPAPGLLGGAAEIRPDEVQAAVSEPRREGLGGVQP